MYPVVNQTTAHANAPSPSRQSQKDQPEHPNVLSCEPTGWSKISLCQPPAAERRQVTTAFMSLRASSTLMWVRSLPDSIYHRRMEDFTTDANGSPDKVRSEQTPLIATRYWVDVDRPRLPNPENLIDIEWDLKERSAVANYLNVGRPTSTGWVGLVDRTWWVTATT